MEEEREYDVVIVGTCLTNSIIAGALARAGKKVLHLDSNEYYGEQDATHDLVSFIEALEHSAATDGYVQSVKMVNQDAIDEAKSESRKYALDVTPKLLLSSGPLVELLVRSGVAKYMVSGCLER